MIQSTHPPASPQRRERPQPRTAITPAPPPVLAIEGAAAVAPVAAPLATSLANLLTRHILRDGEIVILILKPSLWFIVFTSLRFVAAVLILLIGAILWLPRPHHLYVEAAVFVLGGRIVWAILSWIGRLYVLTDQRVLRLSGVFTMDVFDCPLRKVSRARLFFTLKEKLVGLGSIEILPSEESRPCGLWQTVAHPQRVCREITAAIDRAKQGGSHGSGR